MLLLVKKLLVCSWISFWLVILEINGTIVFPLISAGTQISATPLGIHTEISASL